MAAIDNIYIESKYMDEEESFSKSIIRIQYWVDTGRSPCTYDYRHLTNSDVQSNSGSKQSTQESFFIKKQVELDECESLDALKCKTKKKSTKATQINATSDETMKLSRKRPCLSNAKNSTASKTPPKKTRLINDKSLHKKCSKDTVRKNTNNKSNLKNNSKKHQADTKSIKHVPGQAMSENINNPRKSKRNGKNNIQDTSLISKRTTRSSSRLNESLKTEEEIKVKDKNKTKIGCGKSQENGKIKNVNRKTSLCTRKEETITVPDSGSDISGLTANYILSTKKEKQNCQSKKKAQEILNRNTFVQNVINNNNKDQITFKQSEASTEDFVQNVVKDKIPMLSEPSKIDDTDEEIFDLKILKSDSHVNHEQKVQLNSSNLKCSPRLKKSLNVSHNVSVNISCNLKNKLIDLSDSDSEDLPIAKKKFFV